MAKKLTVAAMLVFCLCLGACAQTTGAPAPTEKVVIYLPEIMIATPSPDASLPGGVVRNTPSGEPENVEIKIYKKQRILECYADGALLLRCPIRVGENGDDGHKEIEGDKRTPIGSYYVCTRKDEGETANTRFLGLSYPNIEDAQSGLDAKRIDQKTFDDIKEQIDGKMRPPWDTPLGGAIGIHGQYDDREYTQGCIAISDENVIFLFPYVKLGTPVTIFE